MGQVKETVELVEKIMRRQVKIEIAAHVLRDIQKDIIDDGLLIPNEKDWHSAALGALDEYRNELYLKLARIKRNGGIT